MSPPCPIKPAATAGAAAPEPGATRRASAELARLRHDLRTSASHILGYAEMLLETVAETGHSQFVADLHSIQTAGKQLLERIHELLSPATLHRSQFDARALHAELRTPLNPVIGYSEILLEQATEAGATSLLADLQKIHAAAYEFLRKTQEQLTPASLEAWSAAQPAPAAAPADPLSRWTGAMALAAPVETSTGTLLVVDDDAGNRELLARRLMRQGYQVRLAESGPEALSLLRTEPVDLVLLDLIMPRMEGDQVLAQMKADPRLRHLPVLVMSALDDLDSVVKCILMGAEDYLAKPFNPVLLRARVGACLEKSRLRRQEEAHLRELQVEREKSETLLLNILPRPIVERLKQGESTLVDSLPDVTVLFADLVGFTSFTSRSSSVEVVRLLDEVFSEFDRLAQVQGLEKIKTIGDAYMAVGGMPLPRPDHVEAVAELALQMQDCIPRLLGRYPESMRLRIGISTGPVIAGVIGRNKFAYDLWGDTVNIASRMESHGLPGRIQVADSTYQRLKARYQFEPRGRIEVRNKGKMSTYFLLGRQP